MEVVLWFYSNPVVLSVIVMSVLCLLKLNVLLALIISALVAGFSASMPIGDIMSTLIGGMGGQSETALSYILLGTLAVAIGNTGVASIISRKVASIVNGKKLVILIIIAIFGCFSQKFNSSTYCIYSNINSTFNKCYE